MQRIVLALAVALLLAAAARAVKSGYRERLETLRIEAEAQRAKLGLDRDRVKLYAKYPTPEVTFGGGTVSVGCGQSSAVELCGRFAKGTVFVVRRDDVQAADEKLSADCWRATLRAAKDAMPGPVTVDAFTPVSGASSSKQIAEVRGLLAIAVDFEDCWSARLAPGSQGAHEVQWSKGAEKRAALAYVSTGQASLDIALQPSAEQVARMQAHGTELMAQSSSPELQAAMAKMQACSKLPQDQLIACIQNVQPELQAASEANQKRMDEAKARYEASQPKEAWNCSRIELRGALSHMEGKAECARPLKVTAKVSCTASAGK